MKSKLREFLKLLTHEEQIEYINNTTDSINKSREHKYYPGNSRSIIKEIKQIKEELVFTPIFFISIYIKKKHTIIIMKRCQCNYGILSIISK